MKRNDFLEKAGFAYIANHGTKELHRAKDIGNNCNIPFVLWGGYCTAIWAYLLRKRRGYDGCFYCNRRHHYK